MPKTFCVQKAAVLSIQKDIFRRVIFLTIIFRDIYYLSLRITVSSREKF